MTDRTTKALLFAIALGLWANLASDWLRPTPVSAQGAEARYLMNIDSNLNNIAIGLCLNGKIC